MRILLKLLLLLGGSDNLPTPGTAKRKDRKI